MKTEGSLALALMACAVASAQTGSSGSISSNWGVTVSYESKLEPAKPDWRNRGAVGLKHLADPRKAGMRRFLTTAKTHEYFGYDMTVEIINQQEGSYRVTFSALTLTPEDLTLPDPASWRRLPAPVFPPPQVVSSNDTMAVDVYENPATGQKIVDYIRLKRDDCVPDSPEPALLSCLNGRLQDAQQSLDQRLTHMESVSTSDPATARSIKESQPIWEQYRDAACGNLSTPLKRVNCELNLTYSRAHDVGVIY